MQDAIGEISFGRFRMDFRRRALLVDGKILPLHARAFDVLDCLVAHRDSVLTREEITGLVWRGMAIGENNLTVQMSALRRALAQHGGDGLIVTFAGRGYRFVGDVTAAEAPTAATETAALAEPAAAAPALGAPAAPRRRNRLVASAVACGLVVAASSSFALIFWRAPEPAPRLSIAVLPFRNLTADPHDAYLADAITDDLDTELARALKMQVIGRDSAVSVVQRKLSIQQIGSELGVQYVLDGSLEKTEAGYSVNPHLIDARTGLQLWSVPFTVGKDHFGDLRDVIVRRIAIQLGLGLDALESQLASQQRPNNPDALDLYYQACALLDSAVDANSLREAARLLQASIDKQPDFADALAKLGWVLLRTAQTDMRADSEEDRRRAHEAIQQALEKDRFNAAALAARALELETQEDCPAAEQVAGEALQAAGSNLPALSVLTNCAWEQGNFDLAANKLAAMEVIDPISESHRRRQIMTAYLALLRGDAPGAVQTLTGYIGDHPDLKSAVDPLQAPEYAQILLMAAQVLNHHLGTAKAIYSKYNDIHPYRSIWRIAALNTRAISNSPEYGRFKSALHDAGMAMYASEAPVSGAACAPDYNDFTPTPSSLPPGGQILQTTDMVGHFLRKDELFVIDVGEGVAAYPGAVWADHGEAPEDIDAYVNHILQARTEAQARLPIIIMDNGPVGCAGYLTAIRLLSQHTQTVAWYRGGEESWYHAEPGAAVDHRKY